MVRTKEQRDNNTPKKSLSGDGRTLVKEWELKDVLGRGNESVVYLGVHTGTGEKVAVKVVDISKLARKESKPVGKVRRRIEREIAIIQELDHPCIVRYLDAAWDKTRVSLVMEYVSGGELLNHISDRGVMEEDVKRVFLQLLYPVHYCHLRGIVHRDLKLENVLVDLETNLVKITDFGFANIFTTEKDTFSTMCGTIIYMAPEVLLGGEYRGECVDMWSLGVILYCLLCGRFPFADTPELPRDIIGGNYTIPSYLSKEAKAVLKKMLHVNPKKRATFEDVVTSAFLQEKVDRSSHLYPRHPDGSPYVPGDQRVHALSPLLLPFYDKKVDEKDNRSDISRSLSMTPSKSTGGQAKGANSTPVVPTSSTEDLLGGPVRRSRSEKSSSSRSEKSKISRSKSSFPDDISNPSPSNDSPKSKTPQETRKSKRKNTGLLVFFKGL